MNRINPDKLLMSKWTAVKPSRRERHFMVTKLFYQADNRVSACLLEAVLTRNSYRLPWAELKDAAKWLPGWK